MFWYRLLISLCVPFPLVSPLWRAVVGRGGLSDLSQRLGGGDGGNGALWLHGASNGELTSARALLEAFRRDHPDHPVIVTANTVTGRDLAAGWNLPGVTARLAPVDLRWVLGRFNRRWRPAALLSLENEFWPNRIVTARYPVLCVAARISGRSARRWSRFPGLCRTVFGRVSWLFPQDDRSATRFVSLGLAPECLGRTVSLKSGVRPPPPDAAALAALSKAFTRHSTVLAASTHTGEETIVLDAFALARARKPDLRLIIAPRHPRRGGDVADMARAAGLTCSVRSASGDPGVEAAVYVADTLGEMQLWYALAGVTLVGGSLVDNGGHTPYEPMRLGSAILHGPHVGNFASAYAALDRARGAIEVTDAKSLADGIAELDGTGQTAQAGRASGALEALDTSAKDIRTVLDAVNRLLE
ncbi:MAG: 3-deoxy-D-manno-octulosonic acid transferase [Rhodobacter sp.]|nr:3-deoxy-D-manno-octulosonic acid transferase [Rhodobacter sp.]